VKRALPCLLLVIAFAARADETAQSRFKFATPDGWEVNATPQRTVAVDEEHHLVFQAKVLPGGEPATAPFLDKYLADALRSVQRIAPQAKIEVKKKELVTIAGVGGARFLFDLTTRPDTPTVRTLQFYLPAAGQFAVLSFSGPPAEFDASVALFDRVARATTIKKQ
jgi:hypothetical protein